MTSTVPATTPTARTATADHPVAGADPTTS
jgi:hypothetical protein